MGQIAGGGGTTTHLDPVQDQTAAAALAEDSLVDKDILYIEDDNKWYAYDRQATAATTGATFQPSDAAGATGWWIAVNPPTSGGGDVVGPAGATGDNVAFFDGATGKIIKDSGVSLSGTNTGDEVSASTTTEGIVERATDAEAAAGTDTTRYITPKQLSDNASSVFTATANSTTMLEVGAESDFPAAVGGVITLAANTTYFIRGNVQCTNLLSITNTGVALVGWDRDKDGLEYTGAAGAGDFITITDVSCEIQNLKLSSTNSTGGDVLIRAANFNYGAFNDGRDKVLTISSCQFRNCFDVHHIEGFDLVDIFNTLFWYVEATTIGCQFKNVSKLQISSCEYVRWFDETSIPTPSGYATTPLIDLLANGAGNGFGAVNINGGIIHPQQTQIGVNIDTSATIGFGTLSSSALINVGLTTGKVFAPEIPVVLLPDYSQTATYNLDVYSNQGIINSTSGVVMTVSGNTTNTALTAATPVPIDTGTLALNRASVRYTVSTGGRCTYNGTKQVYVSIHGSIAYQKQGGGTDAYVFSVYKNGVLLAGSEVDVDSGGATADGVAALTYGTLMNQNDYIEVYVENPGSSDDMLIKNLQLVIRE